MSSINLPDFHSLHCLRAVPKPGASYPRGNFVVVDLADGSWLLKEIYVSRARGYSGDVLHTAGQKILANLPSDRASLAPGGLDAAWEKTFSADNEAMFKLFESMKQAGDSSGVKRALLLGNDDHAVITARRIVRLAVAGGVRELLGSTVTDVQSYQQRSFALRTLTGKLQSPDLRQLLLPLGVTDAMLAEMEALRKRLGDDSLQRINDESAARDSSALVDAAKGILYGEILRVSKLAKAELVPARAPLYAVNVLLKRQGRKRRGKQPAAGSPAPVPPGTGTAPTPHGTSHGHGHAHGAPAPGTPAKTPLPVGVPPAGQVAGPVGQPGNQVAGQQGNQAIGGQASGAVAPGAGQGQVAAGGNQGTAQGTVTGTVHGTAVPPLQPGAVLSVIQATGGPQLCAVVQPDGTVSWVPVSEVPAEPASPAQAAPAEQQPPQQHGKKRRLPNGLRELPGHPLGKKLH